MIKQVYSKLITEYKKLRELERQLNQQTKLVEELRHEMQTEMGIAGTDTYKSELGTVSVAKQSIPTVKDWEAFYTYLLDNQAVDLLQRRISTSAWRERVEEGEVIPGVELFEKATLRITAN